MSRARAILVPLLLLALAGLAGAQERPETLPVLEKRRNEAMSVYVDTGVDLDRIEQGLGKLGKDLDEARRLVVEAEAMTAGPLRTAAVQKARQEARAVSDQVARGRMRKDELTTQQELNRHRLIEARSAYATRLLEVAHRNLLNTKVGDGERKDDRQAREQTEAAMAEFEAISKLRALEPALPAAPAVPPLDDEASLEEMQWRSEAYQRQLEAFADQLESLRPKVERGKKHVRRLNALIERGYAVPGLTQTLAREQKALEEVLGLRGKIEEQRGFYQGALERLRKRIEERRRLEQGLRRSK